MLAEKSMISRSLARFLSWLGKEGYSTYDPYDLWATRWGVASRKLFYRNRFLAAPAVLPLALADALFPQVRSILGCRKKRYATADAQLALGFLELHRLTGEKAHLEEARRLADFLIASSLTGYSGLCWGYPLDWQSSRGLWRAGTPFVTVTAYPFEVFLALHDATGEEKYLKAAASTAEFISKDLRDTAVSADAAASSYSPLDDSRVVNASAYRAFVLAESARRFARGDHAEKAARNVAFVLRSQRSDGAWLYAEDNPQDAFIDHFHTCLVLKNLHKANVHLKDRSVSAAIRRGYEFYEKHLFDARSLPRPFVSESVFKPVRRELYDFAEAIKLGVLLRTEIPAAFERAQAVAREATQVYQLPDGHFVTRVYRGGWKNAQAYLRWPQAQMFLALTNLEKALR